VQYLPITLDQDLTVALLAPGLVSNVCTLTMQIGLLTKPMSSANGSTGDFNKADSTN
jgi:hypothetical protein